MSCVGTDSEQANDFFETKCQPLLSSYRQAGFVVSEVSRRIRLSFSDYEHLERGCYRLSNSRSKTRQHTPAIHSVAHTTVARGDAHTLWGCATESQAVTCKHADYAVEHAPNSITNQTCGWVGPSRIRASDRSKPERKRKGRENSLS
jgi:hypothetical protein